MKRQNDARRSEITTENASNLPTRLGSLFQLAETPWFRIEGGRLRVRAPLGPIVDIHAHLAHCYVRKPRVDLHADPGPTRHYLPVESACDLDVYVNQNLTLQQRAELTRDLVQRSLTASGMRVTHTIPNLLREMDDLGVHATVILPVDLPFVSRNATRWIEATKSTPRIVPFGNVHPWSPFIERAMDRQIALGARGFKLHPGMQIVRPDFPGVIKLCRLAGEKGVPVLFHCGPVGIEPASSAERCQVRLYEPTLRANPHTRIVLGHSGALQWEEAIGLSNRYPNAWLDLSCCALPTIRRICADTDPDRILFGSDWPFYHQALPLAKVLMATEGDPALRRKILYDNAARLLGLPASA